jgi:MtrB/PioB family decaheme-associated outer membrane protein
MVYRNLLKAALVAAAGVASLHAFADGTQYGNEVGVGLVGVFGTNANQAGRYNGLNTTGVDVVGEFACTNRAPWESDDASYFDATGYNLIFQTGRGLANFSPNAASTSNDLVNNGSVAVDFGKQGTWEAGLSYDAITYTGNVIDSIYNVNGGQATLNSGLIPFGGATAATPGPVTKTALTIPVLNASGAMQPVQTGTRRDILAGIFKYISGDWTFSGAFHHEYKEGSMEESFTGPWGGTAFALPIDYTTDRYDLVAAYATRMNQVSLQYTFSRFHDGNSFVNLPYPFSNTATPYQLASAYSTPPSSTAQYLTLMAATNTVPNTRINLNLRLGLEMQDDQFAPDTADPNPQGAPGLSNLNAALQGTTANSLDARAEVIQGNIRVNSQPIANLDANAYYGYDRRIVRENQYKVFTGNTGGESDAAFTGTSFVVPQQWLKQDAGFDVGYRIDPKSNTKLTVAYRYDDLERSNAQVGSSNTNTESVTLTSTMGALVYGRLSYEHAERSGALNYLTPWANLEGPPASAATLAYSGAYYQAPMTSNAVKLMADYPATERMSASLFLQYKDDNYTYPPAVAIGPNVPPLTGNGGGIKQDINLTVTPSVSYRPRDDVRLYAFYTFERIYFDNIGNGACSTAAQAATAACSGSAGYFQNKYTSNVNTAGLSGDWKVNDNLKLTAQYIYAHGSVMFGQYNGVFVSVPTQSYQNVTNYPDINSTMNSLRLTTAYKLTPQTDLLFEATWSYYKDNSWYDTASSIQGAGTTTVSILTPGYTSPNYNVGTLMVGVKYHF